MLKREFPKDFLWGTAISAHQVEGNNIFSDWWHWEQSDLHIENSEITCNHYNLYEQDLNLAKNFLNNDAVRLSIEWSRIFPEKNSLNKKEIKHYLNVLKTAKKLGLKTMITLHHFTNPLWFTNLGGWEKAKNIKFFEKFAEICLKEFGELIDYWLIINEPDVYTAQAYLTANWPPQKRNPILALKVYLNLAKTHRKVYQMIKNKFPKSKVGSCTNMTAYKFRGLLGKIKSLVAREIGNFSFIYLTKKISDFIGINYYNAESSKKLGLDLSDIKWEIYPKGIYEVSKQTWKKFKMPIIITENGIADRADTKRPKFLVEHLTWLYRAIKEGADIKGYFHWSLLDNFEWAYGREMRFGLFETNYKTLKRIPRKSARIYAKICQQNAV